MTITQQQLDNLRATFEKWIGETFTVVEVEKHITEEEIQSIEIPYW